MKCQPKKKELPCIYRKNMACTMFALKDVCKNSHPCKKHYNGPCIDAYGKSFDDFEDMKR